MHRAASERDSSYDGVFFVCVRTTGIFCRPSCPAKSPLPHNIEFVPTVRDALLAGYRPCKRCRPMDSNGRPPDWVERLLARVEQGPAERLRDADLRSMNIDPARARRYFRRHYGMTFQAYHRSRRMGLALTQLRQGADLLDVAWDHGFESSSGFRDAFARTFGEPPGRGRMADCIVTTPIQTPLGLLVAGANPKGVCLLEFADRRAFEHQVAVLKKCLGAALVPGRNEHIERLEEELSYYFEGRLRSFTVPLVIAGTPFQELVWRRLLEIPFGEVISYGGLADEISHPGAQRAVGRANGDNRLAILVPCHRVVQKNGELRGYGGGLWRKQFLLDLERAAVPTA
jgi:AraC family transcriptional regulator of adaptative response/methylated-DNA-[protein]-cysteine methyltransferase